MRGGRTALGGIVVCAIAAGAWAAGTAGGGRTQTLASGGTLRAGIPSTPDHLDAALSYTNEGWEILEATNNGLLTFKKAAGGEGAKIVPDIASAMPTITDHGLTYTFHVRTGVRFSPPVNRDVRPSDFKYTMFHLAERDGTFLDYMAVPFAFVMPRGTPAKDVSTIPRWRIATGPYEISKYVPKQEVVMTRNPNFRQWTLNSPNGHLDRIDVKVGITPEQSVNEVANGQLDWYFESVPPDRLRQLKAKYPRQVHLFTRNNITYFSMNERKYPFNKLAVRQAVNYATNQTALVKIFGGQGTPSENMVPPAFGSAYKLHRLYAYNLAKAQRTGTRSQPRRAIRRSLSTTGTRTFPRARTSSTSCSTVSTSRRSATTTSRTSMSGATTGSSTRRAGCHSEQPETRSGRSSII